MHFSDRTFITRGQLAEELHVTKGTIRQWEALRGFPAAKKASFIEISFPIALCSSGQGSRCMVRAPNSSPPAVRVA